MSADRSWKPLMGLRVYESSHTVAAAHAGKLMSELGATVSMEAPVSRNCGACLIPTVAASAFRSDKVLAATADLRRASDYDVVITDQNCCPTSSRQDSEFGESLNQIRIRISPYGLALTGGSQRPGTAFTAAAVAGAARAIGRPSTEPLGLPSGVAESIAGMNAVAACLAALQGCTSGDTISGVTIDVSLAASLAYFVGMNTKMFEGYAREWLREGRRSSGSSGPYPFAIFDAKDGPIGLVGRSREDWASLLSAMGDPAWAETPEYRDPWYVGEHLADEVDRYVQAWTSRHSLSELMSLSEEYNFITAPVRSIAETLEEPQHRNRDFWVKNDDDEVVGPGLPFITRGGLLTVDSCQAPGGERTCGTRQGGVVEPSTLLAGIRVLDLTWVWAGPLTTAILASLGAEVIKVEHPSRPDGARMRGRPMRDGSFVEGPEHEVTPYFHQMGAGKFSFGANLASPGAVAEVRRLARGCDVVVENMRPGVLERRGLGYESLSEENPGLIMLSMSVAGQDGPMSRIRGYAPVMSGLAGLESLVGYDETDITGTYTFALADPIAGLSGAIAVLSALLMRRRSGTGGYIDLSQIEAVISTLAVPIAQEVAGDRPVPLANADTRYELQAAFPCAEQEGWIALSLVGERDIETVTHLVGGGGHRYSDERDRVRRLSHAIRAWTTSRPRDQAVSEMISAGLMAAPVLAWEEDAQRQSFVGDEATVSLFHPYGGRERIFVPPWQFDGARPHVKRRAPLLGEHTARYLPRWRSDRGVRGLVDEESLYLRNYL
jgi:crotonobetainyl-CoA:carnitine CoA-transferase CaiB-like acyl-CoA transferase